MGECLQRSFKIRIYDVSIVFLTILANSYLGTMSCTFLCTPYGVQIFEGVEMAQDMIKVEYTGLDCKGVYSADEIKTEIVGKNRKGENIFAITKNTAPTKRQNYKFVLRQTISLMGFGKWTAKETIIKTGITFHQALKSVIADKEAMRQRAIDKKKGISADEQDKQTLELLTVDELWEQFSTYKESLPKDGSRGKRWSGAYSRTNASDYKTLIKPYIGKKRALRLKISDVELCMDKATKRGLKPRSYHSIRGLIKQMYKWWIKREDLTRSNPADIELAKLNNERNIKLSWEQVRKLFEAIDNYKHEKYRQIWIWARTGRRMGEVVNLERKDIDGNYYTVIASKNKAGVDMIYRVPDGVIIPEKGQWVHTAPTNRDKPVQEQISYIHWQNVVQNADIGLTGKDIHQHDLRHIITTFLEDEGVPKELRKQVIGHKENDMIGRYSTDTHARADLKAEAVQFFLNKVFNRIDRDLKWEQRNS